MEQNLLLDIVLQKTSLGGDEEHLSCETLQLMQSCQSIAHSLFASPIAIVAGCVQDIPAPVASRSDSCSYCVFTATATLVN